MITKITVLVIFNLQLCQLVNFKIKLFLQVLICLGICIYERLQRISLRLREEEGTCQTLAAVAVEALYRKFETAVEHKTGVSKLQLLYDEITQEELTRQQRKEQKKLKRRKKKERQAVESKCKVSRML